MKPIYCLGDPAFWAGTLCLAGIVGNASYASYGGRGQPGEGEFLTGLSSDAMDDGSLHVLTVTVDGHEGLYRGYFDGMPALVPSFLSATTPVVGLAQVSKYLYTGKYLLVGLAQVGYTSEDRAPVAATDRPTDRLTDCLTDRLALDWPSA